MGRPVIPRSTSDPTGQDRRERKAMADFKRRVTACGRIYGQVLDRIDFRQITVNAVRYEFLTQPDMIASLLDEAGHLVDAILLEGGTGSLWFSTDYVTPAYQQGTSQAWANLAQQLERYRLSRPEVLDVITSMPYQRRIGLLRARQFELMRGLSASVKDTMSQVLSGGLATGIGPREIARNLTAQTGIEIRRANRIARTEIGQAFRNARLDESTQAQQDFGIQSRQLHLSALSTTTRATHRARHGRLFSIAEQQDFWSKDGNAINCKCTTVEVLVDDDGQPLDPTILDRARAPLNE